jgi:hypothetical protein
MPKVTVTDTKGLVQESGSGITFESNAVFKSDGIEVARSVSSATLPAATGTNPAVSSLSNGFTHKRRIIHLDSGNNDNVYTLTAEDSGSVLLIEPSNNIKVVLPAAGANDVGMYFTVIFLTAEAKDFVITTAGQAADNNDVFFFYSIEDGSNAANMVTVNTTAGQDILTVNTAGVNSKLELLCVKGGAAEVWMCDALMTSAASFAASQ